MCAASWHFLCLSSGTFRVAIYADDDVFLDLLPFDIRSKDLFVSAGRPFHHIWFRSLTHHDFHVGCGRAIRCRVASYGG